MLHVPIEDSIDLHTFNPREMEPLLEDYLEECRKAGLIEVRIIHGKGRGMLKHRVRLFLESSPVVVSYTDADWNGGGWGATRVVLKPMRQEDEPCPKPS